MGDRERREQVYLRLPFTSGVEQLQRKPGYSDDREFQRCALLWVGIEVLVEILQAEELQRRHSLSDLPTGHPLQFGIHHHFTRSIGCRKTTFQKSKRLQTRRARTVDQLPERGSERKARPKRAIGRHFGEIYAADACRPDDSGQMLDLGEIGQSRRTAHRRLVAAHRHIGRVPGGEGPGQCGIRPAGVGGRREGETQCDTGQYRQRRPRPPIPPEARPIPVDHRPHVSATGFSSTRRRFVQFNTFPSVRRSQVH